jgi:hypothetical protein
MWTLCRASCAGVSKIAISVPGNHAESGIAAVLSHDRLVSLMMLASIVQAP